MTVSAPSLLDAKRPAWLLLLTLPAFAAYLAVAVTTIAKLVESSSAELTAAQISDLGAAWVALHLLWITPPVLASIGLTRLARQWQLPRATAVFLLASITMVLAAAYLVVQVLALGYDGGLWGDSPLYALGVWFSVAAGWVGTLPATILVGVALASRGIARKTAWTVVALTGLYFVFELLSYLPAILGATDVADVAGLPPFLLGFFWAGLAGGVLRARVPS